MAKQYSAKTFLRQVRGALLNRCLQRRGVQVDLKRSHLNPYIVDELYATLTAIPPQQLALIESDFAEITAMATSEGTDAFVRESKNQGIDLLTVFPTANNDYERACWVFLEYPQLFEFTAATMSMDNCAASRWNRRQVGTDLPVRTDSEALAFLEKLLCQTYAEEGRGRLCHVDYYFRRDPDRHCFFAYPEDAARSELGYNQAGQLARASRKRAFEVIFVYRPAEGLLEVVAPGGRDRVEDLAACFTGAILDLEALPPKLTPDEFDLSVLKSPHLSFPTDPADRIDEVRLVGAKLKIPLKHGWRRTVQFAAQNRRADYEPLHSLICDTLDNLPFEDVIVSHATFTVTFRPEADSRARQVRFEISLPNRCTLKDDPYGNLIRKYLVRWRLAPDPHDPPVLAKIGQSSLAALHLRRGQDLASG